MKRRSLIGIGGDTFAEPQQNNNQRHPVQSLMSDYQDGQAITLPIEKVIPDPDQPRQTWSEKDDASLEELAGSIRENKLIQPIVVRPVPDQDKFMLIAGERRWRAAQRAGLTSIPTICSAKISIQSTKPKGCPG